MAMENNNNESLTSENAIDPALLEELQQLESEPRETLQRFRRVYRNQPTTSNKCLQGEDEIFCITPEYDPELERNVIYWRQIEETFQNALYLSDKFNVVYFNQDYDKKSLSPRSINTVLEIVLDVIIENPIEGSKDDRGPTHQRITEVHTVNSNMDGDSRNCEDPGTVALASTSTDHSEITQECTHESDDFRLLHCQSRKYGRGLTLTKAEGGNAESQTDIGTIYLFIVEDYSKAMEWLLKAANQTYAPAQRIIGSIYVAGYGIFTKNLSTSLEWAMKAAEQGDASGQNLVGKIYNDGIEGGTGVELDLPKAMEWYMKAADQGHSRAQRNIGNLYFQGRGYPADYSKALEWFMKAARQGFRVTFNDIGLIYYQGLGIPKNAVKALTWYRRGDSQGEGFSQKNIGKMYHEGIVFPKDYSMAIKWYLKSANQGNTFAQTNLGYMYFNGSEAPKDYSKAAWWFRKAAENDNSYGQMFMGILYHSGLGVDQNYDTALEWYLKAVKQGSVIATRNVAALYRNKKEYPKALEWYTEAVNKGDVESMFRIGELYDFGGDIKDRDIAKAFEWYTKAAEIGFVLGQRTVGYMYQMGRGVSQDFSKALKWYIKAALQGDKVSQLRAGFIFYAGYVPLDHHRALEYFLMAGEEKAANDSLKISVLDCYLYGYGTPVDLVKAKEWSRKANIHKNTIKNITIAEKKYHSFVN